MRTLVSSGSGRPDPLFDRRVSRGTSDPVRMKFLPSKATPLSLSQPVAGSAPMKQKTWRTGFSVSSASQIVAPEHALEAAFPGSRIGRRFPCGSILRYCRSRGCGRSDIATCSRPDLGRAPTSRFFWQSFAGRPRTGRPSCRPDQNDLLVPAQARLDRRSPIPDAASLEIPQVRNVRAPIASTGRNHDRRRLHAPAIIEMERNRHFREVEARHAAGYHHPAPNF